MGNRLFYYGLILSLTIHLIFLAFFSFSKGLFLKKTFRDINVTYQSHQKSTKSLQEVKWQSNKSPEVKKKPKNVDYPSTKADLSPLMKGSSTKDSALLKPLPMGEKQTTRVDIFDVDRKLSLPSLTGQKITNPQYLSYNDTIRAQIRSRAYVFINHPDFISGKVYITFVLTSQGILKDIKIKESKTIANSFLKQISLRSVREAAPFPPFPKGFDYPEFTFNIMISYEK